MLVLEALRGLRVVATPEALDAAAWGDDATVLRVAPDEALAIGASHIDLPDEHAIVVPEPGFVGAWLTRDEIEERVVPFIEWPLPARPPALAQGLVAGVPARLWLEEERALLLCASAYAHDLAERLG